MGDVDLVEKLGRNDLCPCGSGKLFKACCLQSGRYDGANRAHYFQGLTDPAAFAARAEAAGPQGWPDSAN